MNKNFKIALISLIAVILGIILEQTIINFFRIHGLSILNNPALSNAILEIVVMVIPCLIVKKFSNQKLNLRLIGITFHGQMKNIFFGMAVVFADIMVLYLTFWGMKFMSFKGLGFEFYTGSEVIKSVLSVFLIAIFAGICEEIFFRGVLLNYLSKAKGNLLALILSSIIFTIFHTSRYHDFLMLISVFIMAIVLGYSFIYTNSLCLGIGIHFAVDFFTNLVSLNEPNLFIINLSNKLNSYSFEKIFICGIVIIMIFIFMLIFGVKKIRGENEYELKETR
ncbi:MULTISPECIES: CPBP family intramembrane glutamic endopeptidase [Clostridium]|uniref:CPBP family intramembrane glutamic endopeptidase n=1 Tax=Clostridium TaxID=1485 RepID=UPI000825072D|nr:MULTISPECIES: type II CAAX endopeptidase family protein [Clostridium]PJI08969.1 CPBP family intramembrane metalloprotease [Clostridium sp. CT7]